MAIPVSAVLGDNVARRSAAMPWYRGPALLDHLQQGAGAQSQAGGAFRFPVQMVVRDGQDFRGLAGTVTSGSVAVGDEVVDAVSGRRARVRRIVTMGRRPGRGPARPGRRAPARHRSRRLARRRAGDSPAMSPASRAASTRGWCGCPTSPSRPSAATCCARPPTSSRSSAIAIAAHLDLDTLDERPASTCAANDIAVARIDLGRSAALDLFSQQRETGSFMLVDPISGASVAGGVVTAAHAPKATARAGAFRLTREVLARGIGADLPADTASEQELRRRANEVAILMRGAGVAVEIEERWAQAGIDATTVWLTLGAILSFGLIAAVVLGMI